MTSRPASPAARRAFAAFVRVWIVLVILAPGFASVLRSEPVREALKESEWFDHGKDDYRRYGPEDIELPEDDDWRCRAPEPEVALPNGGAVAFFLNGLVYLVLAAVIALILYLIYRVIQERQSEPELLEDLIAADIQHSELPAELARSVNVREALSQERLRELIAAAFESGDLRSAAIYIYLFALLRLSVQGRLELAGDRTARDYVRSLAKTAERPPFDFAAIARLFEFALYRGALPAEVDAEALTRVWRAVEADSGSSRGRNQTAAGEASA